jgi:hypothetical protein
VLKSVVSEVSEVSDENQIGARATVAMVLKYWLGEGAQGAN